MQLATNVTQIHPPVAANDNEPEDRFILVDGWQDRPVPERRWYVTGLIPSRTVTLLAGDGGLGKSLFALQLGTAGVLGLPTVGIEPTRGRVLYVGAEDDADEFHRRMVDILRSLGKTFDDLDGDFLLLPLADCDATLATPDRAGKMVATKLMQELIDEIVEYRPALVVLDTAADVFGGDEIKRSQVRQFVAMLRSIAISVDCAVLLLSHPSVAGIVSGTGTSGSTAWNNSVRSRLYLTADTGEDADEDARVLTTMKANYGRTGDALKMRWQSGAFVLNDGSKPNPARALLEKRSETVFLELLRKLTRQGQKLSPNPSQSHAASVMARQPEAKGITRASLVAAQQRLLDSDVIRIVEEGPKSRRYRRLIIAEEDFGPAPSNATFEQGSNSSN